MWQSPYRLIKYLLTVREVRLPMNFNDRDIFADTSGKIDGLLMSSPLFSGITSLKSPTTERIWANGYEDQKQLIPISAQTKFQIGSITKQFTAVSLLLAFKHNHDPIDEFLMKPFSFFMSDTKPSWADSVTLYHILSHTSGVESYTDYDVHISIYQGKDIRANMLNHLASLTQKKEDIGRFRYGNTGYYLLDFVIKKVTGMNTGDFMSQILFKPLGMIDTSLPSSSSTDQLISEKRLSHMARGYAVDLFADTFQPYEVPWYFPFEGCSTDGGIISTAADLIKWTQDLCRDHSVISKQIADQILTLHVVDRKEQQKTWGYGFGIGICKHNNPKLNQYRHTGLVYGYSSVLSYFPQLDLCIVQLSNFIEDFFKRTAVRRTLRQELAYITNEEEREDRLSSKLISLYPQRQEWIETFCPSLIPVIESFLTARLA